MQNHEQSILHIMLSVADVAAVHLVKVQSAGVTALDVHAMLLPSAQLRLALSADDEQRFIKYVLAFFANSDGIVMENLAVQFMKGECSTGEQPVVTSHQASRRAAWSLHMRHQGCMPACEGLQCDVAHDQTPSIPGVPTVVTHCTRAVLSAPTSISCDVAPITNHPCLRCQLCSASQHIATAPFSPTPPS